MDESQAQELFAKTNVKQADGHPGDDEVARLCCPAVPPNVVDTVNRHLAEARRQLRRHVFGNAVMASSCKGAVVALVKLQRDLLGTAEEASAGNSEHVRREAT